MKSHHSMSGFLKLICGLRTNRAQHLHFFKRTPQRKSHASAPTPLLAFGGLAASFPGGPPRLPVRSCLAALPAAPRAAGGLCAPPRGLRVPLAPRVPACPSLAACAASCLWLWVAPGLPLFVSVAALLEKSSPNPKKSIANRGQSLGKALQNEAKPSEKHCKWSPNPRKSIANRGQTF